MSFKRERARSLQHNNGHIIAALDVETTGVLPGYNEIVQFACVPLNSGWEPIPDIKPFEVVIQPQYIDRIAKEARQKVGKDKMTFAITDGLMPSAAAEIFEHWYEQIGLPEGKRLIPLGQNLRFDMPFVSEWLGHELAWSLFDSRLRDTLTVAQYLNDRADMNSEKVPFAGKTTLSSLAARLGIETDTQSLHDAAYDCYITAKVYEAMLKEPFI